MKRVGEIHEIFVLPECRSKGIGSKLLNLALNYASERRDLVGLWVGEKNDNAKKFYESWGFRFAGKFRKWVRMIKKL